MYRFLAILAVAFLLFPAAARAQTIEAPDAATRSADPRAAEPSRPAFARLRFDVMGGVLIASAQSARVSTASASPAARIDLGIQLGDHAAIFGRFEGGTILLSNAGAAYLATEWTPLPALSLGTGIGYDAISLASFFSCDGAPHCLQSSWSGVSVPLFVGLNVPRKDHGDPSRGRLRIELEGAGGYDPSTTTWGYHGILSVGGAWM